jgi:5-methylcytosine-specific restriction endonuclease McrA
MIGAPVKIVLSRGYSNIGCTGKVYITCCTYNYLSRGKPMVSNKGTYTDSEVDTLKKMYSEYTMKEIAETLGRTRRSVEGQLKKLGLRSSVCGKTKLKLRTFKTLEEKYGMPMASILYTLHWEKNLPIRNGMDKELGCDPSTVKEWMVEFNVGNRNISEDTKRRYSTMTDEQIKAQTTAANEHVRTHGQPYLKGRKGWSTGLTKHDHPGLMSSSIKHMGKNNPMANMRGELHPMWTGGEKYWKHKEWFEIREKAKQRDGYTCVDCGITEEEHYMTVGQPLQVHHIVPYKECKKHELYNLITLCASCHCKADGNLVGGEQWKRKRSQESEESKPSQSTISQF